MNIKMIFSGVLNYIMALGLALVFALFMSGRIGWFLIAAFILAPIISLLLTWLFAAAKMKVSLQISSTALCKGDNLTMRLKVISNSFLPSPPILIDVMDNPKIRCSNKQYLISLMPYSSESFDVTYTAKICGPAQIGLKQIKITDYFGLFTMPIAQTISDMNVSIIPDIKEISPNEQNIKRIFEVSDMSDDSEDTVENSINSFGGFPGFDSREYVPGDPLKRINWKQSARRNKLLIRLDDETACSSISVVLDSVFNDVEILLPAYAHNELLDNCEEDEVIPMIAQAAVEDSLGTAKTLMECGFAVNYLMLGSEGWETYSVADEEDLSYLQTALASYSFLTKTEQPRLPSDSLNELKGSVSVFCTPYFDVQLYDELGMENGISSGKGLQQVAVRAAAQSPHINSTGKAENNEG